MNLNRRGILGGLFGGIVAGQDIVQEVVKSGGSTLNKAGMASGAGIWDKTTSNKYYGGAIEKSMSPEDVLFSKAREMVQSELEENMKKGIHPDWYVANIRRDVLDNVQHMTSLPIKYTNIKSTSDVAKQSKMIEDMVQERLRNVNYETRLYSYENQYFVQEMIKAKVKEWSGL